MSAVVSLEMFEQEIKLPVISDTMALMLPACSDNDILNTVSHFKIIDR